MVKKYRTRSQVDVPIMHRNEEFVRGRGMVPKSRLVLLADVTIECTILQTREIAYFQRMERCSVTS